MCQTTRFELQAVLVAPHRQQGQKLKRADLEVLPIGSTPSQLRQLTPFRTLCGHGVLAEYRVVWDSGYKQLTETKGEY